MSLMLKKVTVILLVRQEQGSFCYGRKKLPFYQIPCSVYVHIKIMIHAVFRHTFGTCMFFFSSLYDKVNLALAEVDAEGSSGGRGVMTRRMTIDEDDVVEFEYEWNDKEEKVVLGKGSFGTVYSAIDLVTKRKMAIKEIPEKTAG